MLRLNSVMAVPISECGCGKGGSDPIIFELSEGADLAGALVLPASAFGSDILFIWARF